MKALPIHLFRMYRVVASMHSITQRMGCFRRRCAI